MIRSNYALRRWLAKEVLGRDLPRKPPEKASVLHPSKPARNARYRAWIGSLPCAACGTLQNVEAAHTGPHGFGEKASDYTCIPLCAEHHRTGPDALHKIGPERFQRRFSLDISQLVARLKKPWFDGLVTTL